MEEWRNGRKRGAEDGTQRDPGADHHRRRSAASGPGAPEPEFGRSGTECGDRTRLHPCGQTEDGPRCAGALNSGLRAASAPQPDAGRCCRRRDAELRIRTRRRSAGSRLFRGDFSRTDEPELPAALRSSGSARPLEQRRLPAPPAGFFFSPSLRFFFCSPFFPLFSLLFHFFHEEILGAGPGIRRRSLSAPRCLKSAAPPLRTPRLRLPFFAPVCLFSARFRHRSAPSPPSRSEAPNPRPRFSPFRTQKRP